jgi:hypothetical protein
MNNACVSAQAATLLLFLNDQPLHLDLLLQRLKFVFLGRANASNKQPPLPISRNDWQRGAQMLAAQVDAARRRTAVECDRRPPGEEGSVLAESSLGDRVLACV